MKYFGRGGGKHTILIPCTSVKQRPNQSNSVAQTAVLRFICRSLGLGLLEAGITEKGKEMDNDEVSPTA